MEAAFTKRSKGENGPQGQLAVSAITHLANKHFFRVTVSSFQTSQGKCESA